MIISVRMKSPGWGGFFIGMAFALSASIRWNSTVVGAISNSGGAFLLFLFPRTKAQVTTSNRAPSETCTQFNGLTEYKGSPSSSSSLKKSFSDRAIPKCSASALHKPQARGVVQGLPLPSRELEYGAACGSKSGVPLRGVVPPSRIHRDQPGNAESGGGAFLQQARDCGAVDQGRQAGGKDDAPELSSFPLEPSAAGVEPAGLQPGEFVAAADVAQANRELVAHEFAATAGDAGWKVSETCALLLAAVGGEPPDETVVCQYVRADCRAVASGRIAWGCGNREIDPEPIGDGGG